MVAPVFSSNASKEKIKKGLEMLLLLFVSELQMSLQQHQIFNK